jgi:hypothetical protein
MNKTFQLNSENSYLYIWKFQVTPVKEAEFQVPILPLSCGNRWSL